MSMPALPPPNPELTREQALNMILSSIAMEEVALSHIMNAEGEKIQYALAHTMAQGSCADMHQLLEVNKSVGNLLEVVMQNQMLLKGKMERVLEHLPRPEPPPKPPVPPRPPCPTVCCIPAFPKGCGKTSGGSSACFAAIPCTCYCGSALMWEPLQQNPVVNLFQENPDQISVPATSCLSISLVAELCLIEPVTETVVVELQILCGEKLVVSKSFYAEGCQSSRTIAGSALVAVPCSTKRCHARIFLRAPSCAQVREGKLRFCWNESG